MTLNIDDDKIYKIDQHTEYLHHFTCANCKNVWSIAMMRAGWKPLRVYCPICGAEHKYEVNKFTSKEQIEFEKKYLHKLEELHVLTHDEELRLLILQLRETLVRIRLESLSRLELNDRTPENEQTNVLNLGRLNAFNRVID